MGSSQKIVKGVVWSTITNVVNAIYGFIAVPLLINYFGKAEYGLIGLAMSVNVYLRLMDMGLNSTNVRFYSTWLSNNNHTKLSKGFQTSLVFYGIIGAINAIVLLFVSLFSSKIFNVTPEQDIILKHLLYILSFTAFCSWFSSCFDQMIKATENIAWIQKRTLFTKILMIVVLFLTIFGGLSIEWYYILTSCATLSIVPMSIGKIKKEIPYLRFYPLWDNATFKEMLPYMMNIFSFSLFQFSFYNLRPVFLGMQGSIESVADYRILNGIIGIVTTLGGAFTGVLLPSSARVVANKDQSAFFRMAYDGTKYISIMICFCCFGMMTVGPEVLTMYVGDSYLYLIPWLNMWLLCTLGTHNQAISSLILAGSDIRAISYNSAFASIIGLISAWFLIPYYEIGGVCIAFAIYMFIQIIFYYVYYWPRKMNISSTRVFLKSFVPYVLVGFTLYCIISQLSMFSELLLQFFSKGVCFSLAYLIFVLCTLNNQDKRMLLSFKRRK